MTIKFYAKGLESYRSCRWKEATGFFEEALKNHPGDNPSKIMFDRCKIYMENPPEKNWDGVFQHTRK
jgi:outer membrane protein assembly factor BamD (BamD/ComL family)